jgi:hypothetical protein
LFVLIFIIIWLSLGTVRYAQTLSKDSESKYFYYLFAAAGYAVVILSIFWIVYETLAIYPDGLNSNTYICASFFAIIGGIWAVGWSMINPLPKEAKNQ